MAIYLRQYQHRENKFQPQKKGSSTSKHLSAAILILRNQFFCRINPIKVKNKIYAIAIALFFCYAKLNAQCTTPQPATPSLVVYTGSKALNQLDIPGTNVQFYNVATGGSALTGTTLVQDDSTYYITQTISGCESSPRKKIKVNRIANDSIVLCNPATAAGLTATPQTGNTASWFTSATGGTALANTTSIPAGTNTLYVEEGRSGTDTIARIAGTLFGVDFNTITVLARGENDTIYFGTYKGDIYRANPDGSDTVKIRPGTQQINWLEYRNEGTGRFLYYTLYAGNDIKKYNLATGAVTTLGSGFFGVRQICFDDASNRIFIADAENYKIKMLNTVTNVITAIDSFPGVFPTSIMRPFALYYHTGLNKLFFSNLDQGKIYSKDLSSLTNPKVEIATVSSVSSISLLPNGKLLLAGGDRIYTLNTDGTGRTTLYSGLYGSNNPFYNNSNLLTYNTHTKIVREALINSNRVPVTVIVNPEPNVTPTADTTVCNGSTIPAINFATTTVGGTVTYNWTNSNTFIGLAASGSGNIASFVATNTSTTSATTATITVTPTFTNGGTSCVGTSRTFTITVNPTATVTTISNKVECNGSTVAAVTPSSPNTGGTVTYAWVNNNTAIGLAASGTGTIPSFTATNTGTSPITATITITPTFTNGGVSCTGTDSSYTITINPPPVFNTIANQAACNGASTSVVAFSTSLTGGTAAFAWTNNNTAIGVAASGSGSLPSFTATNNTTAPISATISVVMTYTNGGLSCVSLSKTFTYTVNPTAIVNAVTNQVVCNGSPTTAVAFSSPTTGGTIVYNWTNNTSSIGLAASGTGNIASFNAVNTGTVPVTATITVTPSYTNAGVTCTGTPVTFSITVNPTAVVNAITSQTLCVGQSTAAVNFTGPVAGTTYSWVNTNTSIGLAASGSGNIPSFIAQNNTLNTISGTITITPNTAAGCVGTPKSFDYLVQALSAAPTGISTSITGPALLVCDTNRTVTLSVVGGGLGTGAVWKWYKDACGGTSVGTGATLSNIDVTQTTTFYVRAEGTCNTTACASVTVQVGKLVTHIRQHWKDVLFFDNSSKNFVSWQWYKNGVIVPGATLQHYSENGVALNGQYYCVATDKNGNQLITCPISCTTNGFRGIELAAIPNPVTKGQQFKVQSNLTALELQGATITISNVLGTVMSQSAPTSTVTAMQAPATSGMYIVTLVLRNGQRYSTTLLVN
ncbi:MAG: T9SS type A sorting domain-containing protein [Ferruginibacter sp.]